MRSARGLAGLAACGALLAGARVPAAPRAALAPPPGLEAGAVGVDEKLGARLPLDLQLAGSDGRAVRLGDLFRPGRPVVLLLAYYRCPMLCDLVVAGLSKPLRELGWTPGRELQLVSVSVDPRDTRAAARLKQSAVLQALNRPDAASGWPFLVGDAAGVRALADAVGFRYAYDPASEQFAHPAVATVLTADGRVARYLYGVDFRLLDLRLAVAEAARGQVAASLANLVDRVLLTCFRYEPSARRYGFYVSAVLKGGASLVISAVGVTLFLLARRDRRRTRGAAGGER
jgi:protein SCO1/2